MCLNLSFIPLVYFWYASAQPSPTRLQKLTCPSSYPETSNLTLEEVDFLFTKEGNTGLRKFTRRSQPVLESLKPVAEIEADIEKHGDIAFEREHVEVRDEKHSEDEKSG